MPTPSELISKFLDKRVVQGIREVSESIFDGLLCGDYLEFFRTELWSAIRSLRDRRLRHVMGLDLGEWYALGKRVELFHIII